jgi:hypothetical protein
MRDKAKTLRNITSIDDSTTVVGCGGSSVCGNTFSKREEEISGNAW